MLVSVVRIQFEGFVHLDIVRIKVIRDTVPYRDGMDRAVVEREQNWAKYGPLGHTKKKKNGSRAYTRNTDRLETTGQVRLKPGEDRARKAEEST